MKIIHTSDWHLGRTQRSYERADEHLHFLQQLTAIIEGERPDAVLVSGDIFDSAMPQIGAQSMLVEALRRLHRASPETLIILTAGNHDSGSRLEIHRKLWEELNVHIVGRPDPERMIISLPGGAGTVVAVPFVSRVQMAEGQEETTPAQRLQGLLEELIERASGEPGPVVVMAHMALGKGSSDALARIGGLDILPLSIIPEGYDYAALGHIHLPHALSARAAYCGSPLPMTFDEDYLHYVNLVDIPRRGTMPEIRHIEIEPLRRMVTLKADSPEAALEALNALPRDKDDYVRVIIDCPGLLPADIDDRCRMALKDTAYRFCACVRRAVAGAAASAEEAEELEIEDFMRISPLEIARRYFEDAHIPDASILLDLLAPLCDTTSTPNP